MRVRVALPDEVLGDVMGDLNTRRASILEMQPGTDLQHIVAYVPQPELINYATDAIDRSLTLDLDPGVLAAR